MAWMNEDGLYIKYGVEKTEGNTAGEYVTTGPQRMIEITIDLTEVTETDTIMSDVLFFPEGRIEKVEVYAKEAATSGGTPALDVGLIRMDRSTAIDLDGLVEALALTAIDAAGETTTLSAPVSGTSVGNLIGTVVANPGYITASRTTSDAYTAGVVDVRIYVSAA